MRHVLATHSYFVYDGERARNFRYRHNSRPVAIGPESPIATGRELSNMDRKVQKVGESIRDMIPGGTLRM